MIIDSLCPPAALYLGFSIIQIIIDLFRGQQNSAFLKIIVMIVFTILLNQLCMGGLTLLSWFIVFIPFIMMTYVTTILLYVFGLNPTKGKQQIQEQPDPRSAHRAPLPYNSQAIGGCARTQFGCCPDGVNARNANGSNCQWPLPYVRDGGSYHYIPTPSAIPSPSPSAIPSPSPSAIPSPSPSAIPSPSPSSCPIPSATARPSPVPSASASARPSPSSCATTGPVPSASATTVTGRAA